MTSNKKYPLTNAQKRIWYTEKLMSNTGICAHLFSLKLLHKSTSIDFNKLIDAIEQLIERNPILRAGFIGDDAPEFFIREHRKLDLAIIDGAVSDVGQFVFQKSRNVMTLQDFDMVQIQIIKISECECLILFRIHPIICDRHSAELMAKEIMDIYGGLTLGIPRAEAKPSYFEYIESELEYENSDRFAEDRAFWIKEFESFSSDNTAIKYGQGSSSTKGNRKSFYIPSELQEGILHFCNENKISVFTLFFSVLYLYLYKINSNEDQVIGTYYANRMNENEKNTLGMFVSTVPFRMLVNGNQNVLAFIQAIYEKKSTIAEHQKYPFYLLVHELRQNYNHANDPLFRAAMEFTSGYIFANDIFSYELDHLFGGYEENELLIRVQHRKASNPIRMDFDYRTDLFQEDEISQMFAHFANMIQQVIQRPLQLIDELDLCTAYEKERLLTEFNETKADYPMDKTIQALFEEQVERTPEAAAVVFGSERLTYEELNAKANQLARVLGGQGVGADRIVAIMAERSLEMAVGILAILKAGGAYLPIDPAYPEERIAYMLEDGGADLLLVYGNAQVPEVYAGEVLDLADAVLYTGDASNLPAASGPSDLAYVIYTSGSTGQPKGVMVEHASISATLQWRKVEYAFDSSDCVLQLFSMAFDGFITSFFTPIISGSEVYLMQPGSLIDLDEIIGLIEREKITHFISVPSLFNEILDGSLPNQIQSLRVITLAGEAFDSSPLKKASSKHPTLEIVNEYGPTENSVATTFMREANKQENILVGKPVPSSKVYVLNSRNQLQPIGVAGELCIAGKALARGYLNRPELTAEKFVDNPFTPGERLYRTGDLARWLPDGNLEYMGRIDEQVKIRGYRIETREIVHRLLQHADVKEAAVIARKNEGGEAYLCAYVVSDGAVDASVLHAFLKRSLPEYMVPSYVVKVERIPLTANGKMDRKALPEPQGLVQEGSRYVAPSSEAEAKLAEIWQELLGISHPVGIRDNFFELGGHSLKTAQLVLRIQKQFNANVPLSEMFAGPTVEELAGYLESAAAKERYEPIGKAEPREWYPASPAQQRMYLVSQLDPGGISYNVPHALEITGELDVQRVRESLNLLAARHESFRTSFVMREDELMQRIAGVVEVPLEVTEPAESELELQVQAFLRPFDLGIAPLLRAGLVRIGEGRHVLLLDMHHIVADGMSVDVFVDEFSRLYAGENLPPLEIHYKDYAVWLWEKMRGEAYEAQEQYWLKIFEEESPVLQLPTDYARPAVRQFEGDRTGQVWGKRETMRLKQLCAKQGVTLYMALLAAYGVLLSRYAGAEDVVVGSPVAGRRHSDVDRMIGMFVNTLPMRSRPASGKRFDIYLAEVKAVVLGAMENQDYPFEELVEKLDVRRETSRNPLFDTMLVLQNMQMSEWKLEGLEVRPYPQKFRVAKFDLTVFATEVEGQLHFEWEYSTALFKKETVERMARHLAVIVEQVIECPDIRLDEIELVREEEKQQLLIAFNDTKVEYPMDKTIHALFEEQAERTPEAVAVVFNSEQLTYRELNAKANRLAAKLRAYDVRPDNIVPIAAERSPAMIVGILAILKAGGAYLPITPDLPNERVRYMLEDCGARWLLTDGPLLEGVPFTGARLRLDDETLYEEEDDGNLPAAASSETLAYVIYTSGSTGNPKGVMIEHRSVVNRIAWMQRAYPLGAEDVILHKTTFTFDVSVWELFWWAYAGASAYFLAPGAEKESDAIVRAIERHEVTTLHFVPSMLHLFLAYLEKQPDRIVALRSLRFVFTSGEELLPDQASRFNALLNEKVATKLINLYGPTEATVDVSVFDCSNGETLRTVPIGKPIDNTRLYILDASGRLLPPGIPGELTIGGVGVARGYLNCPELTAEKFVDNPFTPGEQMYRTGDLARWLPDGNLEYMGRFDEQVKIRGYRIEMGEIVHRLLQHKDVKEAVVIARKDEGGEAYLCAYVVSSGAIRASGLRAHLKRSLPDYMVPAYLVEVERIPLMANGKVDRKALPEPQGLIQMGSEYVAPHSEVEAKLAEIWQDVLRISQPVSIRDNFFELGGDSIKAIQVASRLGSGGMKLAVQDIMMHPTIEEASQYIQTLVETAEQGPVEGETPLSPIQRWFFERRISQSHHWNQAMMLYRADGFREVAVEETIAVLAEHHDALRMVYRQEDGNIVQICRGSGGEAFRLHVFDVSMEEDVSAAVEQKAMLVQQAMDLQNGPLIQLGLFRTGAGDHLLVAIHHLVVDGVSWQILLDDFAAGYEQRLRGEVIALPAKTHSYRAWSERLRNYAQSRELLWEADYWRQEESVKFQPLPKDGEGARIRTVESSASWSISLSEAETNNLLTGIHHAYKTEINDVLLAALGLAMQEWTGHETLAIHLEGHGREEVLDSVDVTRTVGWFTSIYPVTFELKKTEGIAYWIKSFKEKLRRIPNKGVGYGVLKYLAPAEKSGLGSGAQPEISFNYMGHLNRKIATDNMSISELYAGTAVSPQSERVYVLDITGIVVDGKLTLRVDFDKHEYRTTTMKAFMENYKKQLLLVVEHCMQQTESELTPSDLGYAKISLEDFNELFSNL
ncbi:non-ribosomal peptide synthetase [Paenibacillus fonticola]|uniref:non-ribosomal peptide synthetase n=1 Tax=Paenibacillus fonticola TaxID=379896 RepID=UPI000360BF75|nr:non-ribosomal peptide synthetase [Paenibacillus fonticola]